MVSKKNMGIPDGSNEEIPVLSPVDSVDEEESSVYDSDAQEPYDSADSESDNSDDDEGFEDQGSSDEDDSLLKNQKDEEESDDEDVAISYEKVPRTWTMGTSQKRNGEGDAKTAAWMHTDDWSSDDDDAEGIGNRIGRVPIHWYDDFDHVGYDTHGNKVVKSASAAGAGDRIDQAIELQDNMAKGKFVVHDMLNDRNVQLSTRQLELIRRVQGGAFAHPEHDSTPEYIDYFSGVNKEISGLGSDQYERKARFQPSKWEKMQVDKLLEKLENGDINMDYLTGKIRDMNEVHRKKEGPEKPFMLWTGEEEDLLNMRKGPQHIAAPKLPPPGHAESYVPPNEYLPTEEDLKKWKEMEPKDRPHGHLIPKKFPNLRSVGAYEHSVRESFERCLDLYLCPRVMKRRLNIDPESLVPRLPRANDLKPFPTAKCIEYITPFEGNETPTIRCVTASPDGQFMASGASDGCVRMWEVETGRLLRTWDLHFSVVKASTTGDDESAMRTKPVVCLEWNPNRSHHCLLAVIAEYAVVIATGTANEKDMEITEAVLAAASKGGNMSSAKASKSVQWILVESGLEEKPVSVYGSLSGPICALKTNREMTNVRWHAKGDYFVSVNPKAGSAAVLIHQLSKGNSQQPFSKAKGETQLACFHPNKPFLFVASQQHVRIYHLVKQNMVKRLASGCRWISSIDVHPSGDHLIVGSLDRRMIWFDLDLSSTPYKTLKYHERALRSCRYHNRYPLMASASDDGAVHVFHSMVYSDLMRNPLVVPVKILRGHAVTKKLGVLSIVFHPTQPWIFTAGADGRIFLYQDI